MKTSDSKVHTIDDYIGQFPPAVREKLEIIRKVVKFRVKENLDKTYRKK